MNGEENLYKKLFNAVDAVEEDGINIPVLDLASMIASTSLAVDSMKDTYTIRTINIIVARISFIASIWLTIFRPDLWYSMLIFGLLNVFIGDVEYGFLRHGR